MSVLASAIAERLEARRGRPVLEGPSGHRLAAAVSRWRETLTRLGVRRVASRLDNGPDWVALDYALRLDGRVHVPLPTFFAPLQVAHALRDSGAEALVLPSASPPPDSDAWQSCPDALGDARLHRARNAVASVLPDDTACITYTSGTTGAPKGVCLAADTLAAVAIALAQATAGLAPRRHLALMPLGTLLENVAGLYAPLWTGARVVVPTLREIGYTGSSGLDADALLATLHQYRPHSAILVPQLLQLLVDARLRGWRAPDALRLLAVGGAPVSPRLLERAWTLGLPVYQGYGLSECASVVTLERLDARRIGSVGIALPHTRVEVDAGGELHVAGPRFLGYLGSAPPPPGPLATGDLGAIDADGFVRVTGRRRNVFITAFGRNVSPEWVESELTQHPSIAQAAVFGEARPWNVAVVHARGAPGAPALARALADVNAGLPDYARVAAVIPAEEPFSVANGLLTANGRPRRDLIWSRYAGAIENLYRSA